MQRTDVRKFYEKFIVPKEIQLEFDADLNLTLDEFNNLRKQLSLIDLRDHAN